nr:PREDICTED: pentatricopeptide repeat-containing protein At4g19220, mitochondrial isoform X2 [Musa acuminata subsp. malaccensis]
MIRGLRRFVLPTILPSRSLTSTAGPRRSKYLFRTPIANGSSISSLSTHYLLDEMSQTTMFAFRALSFLKGTFVEPDLVSSVHCLSLKANALSDLAARTSLLTAYARAQDLRSAMAIFDETAARDVIFWNAIISAYVLNCHYKSSFLLFQEMVESFGEFDSTTLLIMLMASSRMHYMNYGTTLHGTIMKRNFLMDGNLCNALIDMYAKCDNMSSSELVFEEMEVKDISSWNSMISGCTFNGFPERSVYYFREMRRSNVDADAVTLSSAVTACSLAEEYWGHGESVHALVIKMGKMTNKDIISWNTMIFGFSRNDSSKEEARALFCELLQSGLRCSVVTFLAILPSCTGAEDLRFGKALHACLIRYGLMISMSAMNALMLMYINCGDLSASILLFERLLPISDIVSWNTMIVGCVQNGYYKEALGMLTSMCSLLLPIPDSITFVSAVSACGNLGLLSYGQCLHGLALKSLVNFDIRVKNALLTMYFHCNDSKSAETLFKLNGDRNLCSWNCMISGFAQNKEGDKSLQLFQNMEGLRPNEFSIVGVICACTQLVDLSHGKEVNGYVFRFCLQRNTFILSALVDMYSKCGRLDIATRIFTSSNEKSIASWNSMISAYGFHGQGRRSIELFSWMCGLGVKATKSTFIALLSACSHCGLVDEGWKYYDAMSEKFGIEPTAEHHVCMIDMLGRAGRLGEAFEYLKRLPVEAKPGVWGALLSACHDHGDLDIGKTVAGKLFCLEPENTGYYVTLSNLFAYYEMWSEALRTRGMILDKGLLKPPGCSAIDVLSS